jgi:hypothetical protein
MTRRLPALLLVFALTLTGCSDDEPAANEGPARPTPSTDPAAEATRLLTEQVLGDEEAEEPLSSVAGQLPVIGGGGAVTVDVLEIRAAADSTLLRWRLRSTSGESERVYTSALSLPNRFDTRAVALVDAAGNQRLQPFTYVPQGSDRDLDCICSGLPDDVGATGVEMYALYPPLDPSTTTVDVVIPGFPSARGLAVIR